MAELVPCFFFRTKQVDDFIGKGNKNHLMETNKIGATVLAMVLRMIFRPPFRVANLLLL